MGLRTYPAQQAPGSAGQRWHHRYRGRRTSYGKTRRAADDEVGRQAARPELGVGLNMRSREIIAAYLFLTPFLVFFAIFVARAVGYAVYMSFFDWPILSPVKPFIGLENYRELFRDNVWWLSLTQHHLFFAADRVRDERDSTMFAALAINQLRHAQGLFRVILYMPSLLSVGVIGLTWVWLLNTQFGILNYGLSFLGVRPVNWLGNGDLVIPALSLTTIWWGFGFPMLIFIAGLQGIPEVLYEAARIDGARAPQIFRNITLPLAAPHYLVRHGHRLSSRTSRCSASPSS